METAPSGLEQESLLYRLYQNLPIGVVSLDSRGKILSANRQFRRYFPYYAEGPYGLLLCSAIRCQNNGKADPCQHCDLRKAIRQIMEYDVSPKTMEWSCRQDRSVRWFQVSGIPVRDADEKYAVLFFTEITGRIREEKALKERMKLDFSVGVLNRYGFAQALKALLEDSREKQFTLCITDLDNFKEINDRYGHLTGDKVLRIFSKAARKNIRTDDLVGRYGGDEFLFLFQGIGPRQAAEAIRRIQNELRESSRKILPVSVTFSAGLVLWDRREQPDARWKDLLQAVDRLLYRAKNNGKNQIAML